MWLNILREAPEYRRAARKAWAGSVAKLTRQAGRWARVTNHVDAVVATLLDLAWRPLEPLQWEAPDGQ
eukprot:2521114-Lingulodinium_polyedra.AAC.1